MTRWLSETVSYVKNSCFEMILSYANVFNNKTDCYKTKIRKKNVDRLILQHDERVFTKELSTNLRIDHR